MFDLLLILNDTRKMAGVIVNGKWYSDIKIEDMLSKLETKNNKVKDDYIWEGRKEGSMLFVVGK